MVGSNEQERDYMNPSDIYVDDTVRLQYTRVYTPDRMSSTEVTIFTSTVPFYTLLEYVDTYVIMRTTYLHPNGRRFQTDGIFNTVNHKFTVLSCMYYVDRAIELRMISSYYPHG